MTYKSGSDKSVIKAVFFDIDNTLLSFREYVRASMKKGFEEFGIGAYTDESYAVFNKINDELWKRIEKGELTLEGLKEIRWNMIFAELGIVYDGVAFESWFRDKLSVSAIPEKGALELLEYLYPKYTLCTASNGPYDQQINRLHIGGMFGYFTHNFISEKVGAHKPSREFFETCFQELEKTIPGILPQETVMIGDSKRSDVEGGRAYGMHTCLYSQKEEDPGAADHVVSRLCDIKSFL